MNLVSKNNILLVLDPSSLLSKWFQAYKQAPFTLIWVFPPPNHEYGTPQSNVFPLIFQVRLVQSASINSGLTQQYYIYI